MITPVTSHCPAIPERIPATELLENLQRRWTLQILLCVNAGAHRFVDLRAAIPQVSANVLTQRLRALESAALIERPVHGHARTHHHDGFNVPLGH